MPWTETHALIGHVVHFHVAPAAGRAHEEPAQGTAKRSVSCKARGELVPTARGTGQAPRSGLLCIPSATTPQTPLQQGPDPAGRSSAWAAASFLHPLGFLLSPGSTESFSEQRGTWLAPE